ncbi:MAG: antitermination protein NusB [Clostridiales bacterium 38-18]|nr:MAG: antitermination protein NusB [Clostridiales bacterium 38-18]
MSYEFDAVITKVNGKNASYITPPFDIQVVFGSKRVKVKATFDGIPYRGSIVIMGGITMLGITQDIRDQLNKSYGDTIHVTLEKDEEERMVELSEDVLNKLNSNIKAKAFFDSLSYSHKRQYILWIESSKKEETRHTRIEKMIQMLEEKKRFS